MRGAVFLFPLATCAALHDAARVNAGIFSANVRTCTAHLSAVGTCYLFTMLLGSVLAFFFRNCQALYGPS